MDVWFSGYNPEVITSTWVGFDNYTPLGRREFGGTAALPIWIDYMREALRDTPELQRPVPPGIVSVRIDPDTGLLAKSGQGNAIFEYFLKETVPGQGSRDEGNGRGSQGGDELVRDIF
jgi:penicillin-binding protein 1A